MGWTTWPPSTRATERWARSSSSDSARDSQARRCRTAPSPGCLDDIAEATGDRSTATWLATQTRDAHGTVRRHAALASALDSRWTQTADALGAGDVNLAQARVVVEALEALPNDLGDDLLVKAEAYLLEQATELGPAGAAHLGRGSSSTWPPTSPTRPTTNRLLADETRANAATVLFFTPRGDGSTDLHARIPDLAASRCGPTWPPSPPPAEQQPTR